MGHFFSFWWDCARDAARGSSAFANDWQWLLGIPILAVVVGTGADVKLVEHPILNGLIVAAIAFAITFVVRFLIRLANAPVRLDLQSTSEIMALQARLKSSLRLKFDVTIPGCMEITGDAPVRNLTVRVLPIANTKVENCTGQLLRIQESTDGKNWINTNYIDALDLRWTHRDHTDDRPMRLLKDAQQTLDVFFIAEKENVLWPSTIQHPRVLPRFNNGNWFKFDIRLSGNGDADAAIALRVRRGGTWDKVEVEVV